MAGWGELYREPRYSVSSFDISFTGHNAKRELQPLGQKKAWLQRHRVIVILPESSPVVQSSEMGGWELQSRGIGRRVKTSYSFKTSAVVSAFPPNLIFWILRSQENSGELFYKQIQPSRIFPAFLKHKGQRVKTRNSYKESCYEEVEKLLQGRADMVLSCSTWNQVTASEWQTSAQAECSGQRGLCPSCPAQQSSPCRVWSLVLTCATLWPPNPCISSPDLSCFQLFLSDLPQHL